MLPSSGSANGLLTNEATLREVLAWMSRVAGRGDGKCELHTRKWPHTVPSDVSAWPVSLSCSGSGPK